MNSSKELKKELSEKFDSMFNMIESSKEKIIRSINILKYKKDNLHENINVEDKKKYQFAKELQDKYITPLYRFTNDSKNGFMKDLTELRNYFEENILFYNERRKLEYYMIQIPLYIKEIMPIRNYIVNFIKQEELNIKRNIGSEKLFNELNNYVNEYFVDNSSKKYLWGFGNTQEINKLNKFFKASGRSSQKDENIKSNKLNSDTFNFYNTYIEEKILMIKREQKQKIYENNNFIEEKLRKEERLRKDKFLKTFKRDYIKVITNRFEENQIIDVDLCETTIEFLNKNYNQWDLGYFSYLISFLLKELNYEDDKLNRSLLSNNINESQRIILNNISVYSNYNVKELKKNHKKIIYKDINLKYTPIMEKNND